MRTVVFDQDMHELEVKPHGMLNQYRDLLEEDVKSWLAVPNRLAPCACPGCQSDTSRVAFDKFALTYLECASCKSVYVSPRPSEETLVEFYRYSKAMRFWREQILPETRETRRRKLFRLRAQWLLDVVDKYRSQAQLGIVVGYHNELLIQELVRQEKHLFQVLVTNPLADLEFAEIDLDGVTIRPTPIDELTSLGSVDLILAFDIIDRCSDVEGLFAAAREILAPGGLLLATTTLISGFDLQVLWDRSDSIYPPERLNLFSTEGLMALFERHGFEPLEFSTPGLFDVELVQHAIQAAPEEDWPRFIRYLVQNRDERALSALQEYLQRYRLSSFGRIVLRRPF